MDCEKVGRLICALRREKGFTQRQLADMLHLSDRTVSKWERGLGCPDVSLLSEVSRALGVNIEGLLAGELDEKSTDGGNMKRLKFYVCPQCGNILTATSQAEIACCGKRLEPLKAQPVDETHRIHMERVEDDDYITFDHEMTKTHFLRFFAYAQYDRLVLVRLYPEQGGEVRLPAMRGGKLYFCCSEHGLFEYGNSSGALRK